MKTGVFIRKYKGLFTVEYHNASIGITLFSSRDKGEADRELAKWDAMSEAQIKDAIMSKY